MREKASRRWRKHGASETREYRIWRAIKTRCTNSASKSYPDYGGRGIKMCSRWAEDFASFIEDMGPAPEDGSIERIDNEGDYCPGNCKWASRAEQNRNKRNCRFLEAFGQTKTLAEWAESYGVNRATLWNRLKRGLSMEEALTMVRYSRGH